MSDAVARPRLSATRKRCASGVRGHQRVKILSCCGFGKSQIRPELPKTKKVFILENIKCEPFLVLPFFLGVVFLVWANQAMFFLVWVNQAKPELPKAQKPKTENRKPKCLRNCVIARGT
jgi:hypothetical protein